MKKLLPFIFLCVTSLGLYAQISTNKYWVQFTDKNGTPYSINNPEEFLSERSLQRRQKLGIAVDEYDLPVNPEYLQAVAGCGVTLLNPSKWLNGVTVYTPDVSAMEAVGNLPFVENTREFYSNESKQLMKEKSFLANDGVKPADERDILDDHYGYAYIQISQLNGVTLHNEGFEGQGMLVGICDGGFTGADYHEAFEAIRNEGRLIGVRDFVHGGTNVFNESSHGTAVFGLIGGNVPGTYVGTAPQASFFLCRTEDVGTETLIEEYNWVSGMELLDSLGVDVVNSSLGYISLDDSPMWSHTYSEMDGETCVITNGAEIACSRGIICVNSNGNEGSDWNDYRYMGAPADAEHVLSVGAVGDNGQRAYFSSIGPTYDGRVKPDVMAHGENTYVVDSYGGYYQGSGTSYASPVMAGMVACLLQSRYDASPDYIRNTLRMSGNNASHPDNYNGYGIPDFMAAYQTLGVEEKDFDTCENFKIFPNPAKNGVKVSLNTTEEVTAVVYDIMGRSLYFDVINNCKSDKLNEFLSSLDPGVYMVGIGSVNNLQSIRFIKY